MPAMAPPPFGAEPEPNLSAQDTATALSSLRRRTREQPRSRASSLVALGVLAGSTLLAATIGALVNTRPRNKIWYRLLRKPSFTPPDRVFGLVWPPLYAMSIHSGWRVWRSPPSKARTTALALWGVQTVFNGAWSLVFFGKHRPKLALADLIGNYVALVGYATAASKVDRPAAAMTVPVLGWLTYAGAINAAVIGKRQLVTR